MNPLTVSVFLIIDFVASRVERQRVQEEAQFAAFRKKLDRSEIPRSGFSLNYIELGIRNETCCCQQKAFRPKGWDVKLFFFARAQDFH